MYKGNLNTSKLYLGLAKQAAIAEKKLHKRHPHVVKFFTERGITPGRIREHAARVATATAMAGAMLFAQPLAHQVASSPHMAIAKLSASELRKQLSNQLTALLPDAVEPLTHAQEEAVTNEIKSVWGIDANAMLSGERLNRSYGYMGAEQHLPRYPGDSVGQHDEYQRSGITPGRGAWGYFADSRGQLTQDLVQKEKWYVAVQTLYLPDWNTRTAYLRDWYQYRKVLVVNPQNGKTVVADVADAGPADWTGKHYGGSPEIMAYLGINVGKQKGAVILFFVDDPNNEIPLGPVEYNVRVGRPMT